MAKRALPVVVALAYTACAALILAPAPASPSPPHGQPQPRPTQALQRVLHEEPTPAPPTRAAPATRTPGPATVAPVAGYYPPTKTALPPAPPLARSAFDYVGTYGDECVVLLEQVPALAQERNLSCEAAAIRMVLAGRGLLVAEEAILDRMGLDPNPHLGFRGNVDGQFHLEDLADYGTYAEVVARVLASFGAPAEVRYGMSDAELRAAVEGGSAVIVWMTRQPEPRIIEADGYRLVDGQHVQVVVGLGHDGRFLVHDPWSIRPDSGREGTTFVAEIQQWDLFDRMAVVTPVRGDWGGLKQKIARCVLLHCE
jgi:uncharacterized protein YvpB